MQNGQGIVQRNLHVFQLRCQLLCRAVHTTFNPICEYLQLTIWVTWLGCAAVGVEAHLHEGLERVPPKLRSHQLHIETGATMKSREREFKNVSR